MNTCHFIWCVQQCNVILLFIENINDTIQVLLKVNHNYIPF